MEKRFFAFLVSLFFLISTSIFAQITLTLPTASGLPNSEVVVPVTVSNLSGLNISSFQFQVNFNNSVMDIIQVSSSGTLTDGNTPTSNASNTSKTFLRVAWASSGTLSGSGTLFNIKIKFKSSGTSPLTYIASDGSFTSVFGSPSQNITVTPVNGSATVTTTNNPPVFDTVSPKTVNENQLLSFTVNATDPEGQTLTYTTGTLPTGANFNATTKTFTWTPTYDQSGSYSVQFFASDGTSTASLTVQITVVNVNRNPTLNLNQNGPFTINENQNLTIQLTGSDSDQNAVLTYSGSVMPSGATLVKNSNTSATFSWTPSYTQSGSYTITFTVTDENGATDSKTVQISVVNVNTAPVFTPVTAKTVNEGALLTFTVSATDAESDVITYSATNLPTGATFNSSTRTFSWTPTFTQAGNYTVRFTASDGVLSTNLDVQITVVNANAAPVFTPVPSKTVNEGELLSFTVSATDADGDQITYGATNLPSGATFNSSTRTFSWTPTFSQAGNYTVQFSASDGAATTTLSVSITVVKVNQNPTLTISPAGPITINENETLTIQLTGSDPDQNAVLTYSGTNMPSGATLVKNSNTSATFTWKPSFTQSGSYTITFTVTDENGATDSKTVQITVVNVNTAPVFTPVAAKTVNEGVLLTFTVIATDAEGDALAYSATNLPTGATFTSSTRTFNWTPNFTQSGNYTVLFTVSDGVLSANMDVEITVINVNRNPSLSLSPSGPFTIDENQKLTIQLTGSDPDDGAVLTYTGSGLPTGSTLVKNSNTSATFEWTPNSNQSGTYTFTLTVTDEFNGSDSKTVQVTVNDISTAPTLSLNPAPPYLVNEGQLLDIQLLGTDPDVGAVLKYSATNMPSGATLGETTGLFSWTPQYTQSGIYSVTFKVTDETNLSDSKTATITVNNLNRAPLFTVTMPDRTVQVHNVPVEFSFQYQAMDPDEDPLTYTIVNGPAGAAINSAGLFKWSPAPSQASMMYLLTVQVSDGGLSATTSCNITTSALVSVEDKDQLPSKFNLAQNYPNPFNPETTIEYSIPEDAFVSIKVYTMLGEEISTLVNSQKGPGTYRVQFDTKDLQSGIYFYKMITNKYSSVKKMLLLR